MKKYLHLTFVIGHLTFSLLAVTFALTTFDPMTISVGARSLGMGKTYVCASEGSEAIFTNPAGLGKVDAFEFTSMSGRVLEDVNYTVLGGTYPLGNRSAIGIGYALASVSDIDIRNSNNTYLKKAQYGNSVVTLSYGKEFSERFALGMNLKYYSQDGTENNDSDGTAVNLDVGLLQKGTNWMSFGIVGQNVLAGNKIKAQNGYESELPRVIKAGANFQLLGQEFESAVISPVKLTAAIDADLNLQSTNTTTIHSGLEFTPIPMLSLRAGVDQQNYTYGLSLRWAGVSFHYAYHPYGEFTQNASSFFSLTFNEKDWPIDTYPDFKASDCQKHASVIK